MVQGTPCTIFQISDGIFDEFVLILSSQIQFKTIANKRKKERKKERGKERKRERKKEGKKEIERGWSKKRVRE